MEGPLNNLKRCMISLKAPRKYYNRQASLLPFSDDHKGPLSGTAAESYHQQMEQQGYGRRYRDHPELLGAAGADGATPTAAAAR